MSDYLRPRKDYKSLKSVRERLQVRRQIPSNKVSDASEAIACKQVYGRPRHCSPPPTRLQQALRADVQRPRPPVSLPRLSILESDECE